MLGCLEPGKDKWGLSVERERKAGGGGEGGRRKGGRVKESQSAAAPHQAEPWALAVPSALASCTCASCTCRGEAKGPLRVEVGRRNQKNHAPLLFHLNLLPIVLPSSAPQKAGPRGLHQPGSLTGPRGCADERHWKSSEGRRKERDVGALSPHALPASGPDCSSSGAVPFTQLPWGHGWVHLVSPALGGSPVRVSALNAAHSSVNLPLIKSSSLEPLEINSFSFGDSG